MTKTSSLIARTLVAAAFTMMAASAAHAAPTTYEIDKVHSSILFKIRHMLSKTAGQFQQFSGTVTVDPDKRDSVEVSAAIVANSIDTDDAKRDQHLRGADFFDVEKFPQITFTGGQLSGVNADRTKGKVEGMLTLHGVTKPVVLDVEWLGVATDPWGNTKAAFSATTKINRKDFGMVWNKTLDAGGYLIGEEVEIELNIEAAVPKPK